jgi:hypothetical protein
MWGSDILRHILFPKKTANIYSYYIFMPVPDADFMQKLQQ